MKTIVSAALGLVMFVGVWSLGDRYFLLGAAVGLLVWHWSLIFSEKRR